MIRKRWPELVLVAVILFSTVFILTTLASPPLHQQDANQNNKPLSLDSGVTSPSMIGPTLERQIQLVVRPETQQTIPYNLADFPEAKASFISAEGTQTKLSPKKLDVGKYEYAINNTVLTIYVTPTSVDSNELKKHIQNTFGSEASHYSIFIYDLIRKQVIEIGSEKTFPPASISKLPSVALVLRDIDSGKFTFDTPITVMDRSKHSTWDSIGKLPQGTAVPLRTLIDEAILRSSNTAHYHLHNEVMGNTWDVIGRTKNELNIDKFWLNPHEATAADVGKFFIQLYEGTILSQQSSDYLINLLFNAAPSLKQGIPVGISDPEVKVANKAGFLFGGQWGTTYSDAGIVYGHKTDYVLVILNDAAPVHPNGKYMIQNIAKVVHSYLDR